MEYFSWSPISKERKDAVSDKTAAQATVQPQQDRQDEAILNRRNLLKCPSERHFHLHLTSEETETQKG